MRKRNQIYISDNLLIGEWHGYVIFVDTANIADIKEAHELGILAGVTTNPSLK
ncbi:hypothetical protein ACEQPO_27575 [Bacillus sp. SL00103]